MRQPLRECEEGRWPPVIRHLSPAGSTPACHPACCLTRSTLPKFDMSKNNPKKLTHEVRAKLLVNRKSGIVNPSGFKLA
jgi:hypothetical protein